MSWWISLEDHEAKPACNFGISHEEFVPDYPGDEPCPEPCFPAVNVQTHTEGGTYALGGTHEATVNVTYNYGRHFPFRSLHGRRAKETVAELQEAVKRLGTKRSSDYWEPTPGNAGSAVALLSNWAKQYPEAIWRVN